MTTRPQKILLYIILAMVSLLFLFPFYWLLASSLKSRQCLSMIPPAYYPARTRTTTITLPAHDRLFHSLDKQWFRLLTSPDLLDPDHPDQSGAYYIRLQDYRPSQEIAWLPHHAVRPIPDAPSTIVFSDVPVHEITQTGQQLPLLARMVRQGRQRFHELLFFPPPHDHQPLRLLMDTPHQPVREFAPRWANYRETLRGPEATFGRKSVGFLRYMRNSFFISFSAVFGQMLSSSLVAFAFARLQFKGRDPLFIILLATLMIPGQVTFIPLFWIYKSLGWIDTFLPLIVPHFCAGAFNVFLMRQYMLTLPKELDDSAAIDGCGPWGTFRHIILPNCKPVLIVIAIFTFVYTWQDIMGPLIYLDNPLHRTVTLGLEYFRSPYVDNRHLIMTGAVLAMLPVALVFLFLQRYIMSGIATTGLKG